MREEENLEPRCDPVYSFRSIYDILCLALEDAVIVAQVIFVHGGVIEAARSFIIIDVLGYHILPLQVLRLRVPCVTQVDHYYVRACSQICLCSLLNLHTVLHCNITVL